MKKQDFLRQILLIVLLNLNFQGVANRGCSIRVGRDTEKKGKGIWQNYLRKLVTWCNDFIPPIITILQQWMSLSSKETVNAVDNHLHYLPISWAGFFVLLGYLEDRRPASNMDPYVVTSLLAETTILWEPTLEAEALAAQKLALKV